MYTAVIVEPRCHKALGFVLNNILTNLSDDWNVVVCHGTQNIEFIQNILDTDLARYKTRVTLHNLGIENMNIHGYNALLALKTFYELIPTEVFLVFQTDSMIIPKYAFLINSFLEFDYVGAPWHDFLGRPEIGNGGFSLRRKTKMLEIIEKCPYSEGMPEDVYFSMAPIEMKKPTYAQAQLFSVEQVFSPVTFGCHKPWDNGTYQQLCSLCSDVQQLRLLQ
jgi:hypothetical protein